MDKKSLSTKEGTTNSKSKIKIRFIKRNKKESLRKPKLDRSLSILSAQAKHIIIERNRLFCPPLINLKWSNGVRFYIQDSRGNKIRRDQTDVSCLVWGCPWCAEYFLHKLHSTQSLHRERQQYFPTFLWT